VWWYFREIDFENIYVESVKNENIVNLEIEWFIVCL
jgi:hypothetical protein